MTQTDKIEKILDGTCSYFGLTRDEITDRKLSRSDRAVYMKFVVKALKDNTTLPTIKIANMLGYKEHSSVLRHDKDMSDMLSDRFYRSDKTVKLYNEYLNHLNL